MRVLVKFGASANTECSAAGPISFDPDTEGGDSSSLGQRAGMSPEGSRSPVRALLVRTGVAWGVGRARKPDFRAVVVAIDRLSLLVAHFGVAVERASTALLPPPIEPEGH
jgi:hypothetical protein